jgi:hypothetical protein
MDAGRCGRVADSSAGAKIEERSDLSTALAEFCTRLRAEHDFGIGQSEALDALRAV